MKIVICGGHLTPALAVIEQLKNDDVIYIGRKYAMEGDRAESLEYQTIKSLNIPFEEIRTGRIQRSFTRHTIPSVAKIPIGLSQAIFLLKSYKPDVVVGFGGYVSAPVIIAAHILKIPVVLHEQTLEAGAANKYLAKFADKICISFPDSEKFFPIGKTILTGNPIRSSIVKPTKKFDLPKNSPVIYVTGGSQGSHFINELIERSLTKLLDRYIIVHQTGGSTEFNDFEKLTILKEGLNSDKKDRYILSRFFEPDVVGSILKQSKMVISRSGVNTISELIYLKKPAFLIPLPSAQKNEQQRNAEFFKNTGLGEYLEQKDLNPEEFLFKINGMMQDIESYAIDPKEDYFPKNAAKKIVEIIYAAQKNSN